MKKPETIEEHEIKLKEMFYLLIECRNALPAISLSSARLMNIRLDLADRIEACLRPWEIKEPPSPLLHSQSCVSDNPSTPAGPSQVPQS
jgi:hypothetical protein